jgi:hypothetical protein
MNPHPKALKKPEASLHLSIWILGFGIFFD